MHRISFLRNFVWYAAAGIAALIGCSDSEPMRPAPPSICLSSSGWFVGGRGGISPVVKVSNCGGGTLNWTVRTDADWLTISKPTGTAPGSFQVIAAPNRSERIRSHAVVVKADGASNSPQSINVSQGAGWSSICVSPAELTVPPEGVADAPIRVENCGTDTAFVWSAAVDAHWVDLSRDGGNEPGLLTVAVPPNYTGLDRSGTITVTAAGIEGSPRTVVVMQPYALLADARSYEVGGGPVSIAGADLDGDGDVDILVGNALTDDICVFKNKGDGTFSPPRFHVLRVSPSWICCADVDGDRREDIVVRSDSYAGVTVLRNLGGGTLDMPTEFPAGVFPVSLVAADFDADGDDDLALVDGMRPAVVILTATGDGGFSPPSAVDLSVIDGIPMGICSFDVDFDLKPDLIVAAEFPGGCSLAVIRNRGDGTFGNVVFNSSPHLTATCSMLCADFNGDEDTDIATVNGLGCAYSYLGERLLLFANKRRGIFEEAVSTWKIGWATLALSAADLDGDRDVDLVLSNLGDCENVCVMRNDGSGTFGEPAYFSAGIDPIAITCADFDGDGDIDIAVANAGSFDGVYTMTVLRNFTQGPSSASGALPETSAPSGL